MKKITATYVLKEQYRIDMALLNAMLEPAINIGKANVYLGKGASLSRLIADKKLDVNKEYSDGNTLLYRAVFMGNELLVKELLDAGADANKGTWLPLHTAAFTGKPKILQTLINNGADANKENSNSLLPLKIAEQRYNETEKHGKLGNCEEYKACVNLLTPITNDPDKKEDGPKSGAKDADAWVNMW